MSAGRTHKSLGEVLVDRNLITEAQLASLLNEQRARGGKTGYLAVRMEFLPLSKLVSLLEEFPGTWGYEYNPAAGIKSAAALRRKLAFYYKIAPVGLENGVLTVGISDLENPHFLESLAEITGYKIDPMIFPESEIRSLLLERYALPTTDPGLEISSFSDNVFTVIDTHKGIKALAPGQLKKDAGTTDWLRSIIAEAIKEKSREILIRPEPGNAIVSFKREVSGSSEFALTADVYDGMTLLIYQLAKLDAIGQPRLQSGRFRVKINDRRVLMVVTVTPGVLGARIILEMFDEKLLKHSYDQALKPQPELKSLLEDFLERQKKGMCVITGPEGSGRTLFLYGLLSHYKENFRQIVTLENRIRYPLNGVNQREVAREEMINALIDTHDLRPDLLAIHTLQDEKAAESAFLFAARIPVIAVMPSFDCYYSLEWFCAHHLKSAIKAGLIHTILSFRLIPRICPNCSVPFEPHRNSSNLNLPPELHLKMNQGCDSCRMRDHENAELFVEFVRVDPEMKGWVEKDCSASSLRQQSRTAGNKTLYDAVMGDAFTEHLDMLSVMKLHATLA